jgi:hypothetical protein
MNIAKIFGLSSQPESGDPSSAEIAMLIADAQTADSVGDVTRAGQLWQLVLERDPENLTARAAVAELLLESGKPHDAAVFFQPIADKQQQEDSIQRRFLELLIAAGEFEWAKRHAENADTQKPNRSFRAFVAAAETSAAASTTTPTDTHTSEIHSHSADWLSSIAGEPLFNEEHALRFANLFQGRADVFARMWVSDSGATGYSPVYRPYTPRVVLNHLLGNYTTGIYLTRADGAARILAFDIDIASHAIEAARGNTEAAASLRTDAFAFATQFAAALRRFKLHPVIEDSGYKGAHLWIIFDDWHPCGRLRRLGEILVRECANIPPQLSVEVFPKQTRAPQKVGNLIKLPLGIHRKTGRRSVLLDPQGTPFDNQPEALMQISLTPSALLQELLDKLNTSSSPPTKSSSRRPAPNPNNHINDPPEQQAVALASAEEFTHDPVLKQLRARCHLLDTLINRILASRHVSYDERLILEHTLGHLPNGARLVNFLLFPCENFDTRFLMGRPHRGHPMSCAKMAARAPHIVMTSACICDFSGACANYPTPLNHLYSHIPLQHLALPSPSADSGKPAAAQTAFDVVAALNRLHAQEQETHSQP